MLLGQPHLLVSLLSSSSLREHVADQDEDSSISKLCWHAGLAVPETEPRLQHELLLLSAQLLPPGDGAVLAVRLASVAAGLAVLSTGVEEELVRRVRVSLDLVEATGASGRVGRTVLLYRMQLSLLCGQQVGAEVARLAELRDRTGLEVAVMLALRTKRPRDEEVAVTALLAVSELESEQSEKEVTVTDSSSIILNTSLSLELVRALLLCYISMLTSFGNYA